MSCSGRTVDQFVVIYLDDIVVYSQNLRDHQDHLRIILQTLRENELYVKAEKCTFGSEEISFLGHRVGRGQIQMETEKVRAILDWVAPKSVTELRSFLGLASYYRRFILQFAQVAAPFTDLLKKDRKWDWNALCEEAFNRLNGLLAKEPVLNGLGTIF